MEIKAKASRRPKALSMIDVLTFLLGTLALLATPGPTNTLLATSGAVSGLRRSLPLLCGELAGYLVAIAVLHAVVGPVVAALPLFGIALRIAVCLYLVHLALAFWRQQAASFDTARAITPARVFGTTLLNPKAVIFAFTLLPFTPAVTLAERMPWLVVLSLLIVTVGAAWIALGASLQRGTGGAAGQAFVYKVAAVALMLIVAMIGWNTVALAWA